MKTPTLRSLAALAVGALVLTGCTENRPTSTTGSEAAGPVTVTSTDTECKVSVAEATSGTVTFSIKNEGSRITEFYLLASDGLRIVSEKENIAAGASADLTVSLQPGDYFTACKPGMRGENVGQAAFKVAGEAIELSGEDKALFEQVVADYVAFVRNEVSELEPKTEEFATAYIDGDDEKARDLYAKIRVHYERIEPIAEALGTLDPRIDYREIDYLAESDALNSDDPTFTQWLGFHRIEKDLWVPAEDAVQPDGSSAHEGWQPSTPEQRKEIGQTLIEDVRKLNELVSSPTFIEDNEVNISTVSNGASGLLEEIAVTKVTGEENWWSHYDLWDFQANLEGARIAFDLVAPIAERKSEEGKALVADINKEFDALQALLDKYGNLDKGYVLYDQVTAEQQKELSDQINALREPLSRLTVTVLGIEGE